MKEIKLVKLHYLLVQNKGFISSYFLILFVFYLSISSIIFVNLNYEIKTIDNLKKVNQYRSIESKILNYMKYNELEKDIDAISLSNCSFQYEIKDNSIRIIVFTPIQEELILYLKDGKIYDYDSYHFNED